MSSLKTQTQEEPCKTSQLNIVQLVELAPCPCCPHPDGVKCEHTNSYAMLRQISNVVIDSEGPLLIDRIKIMTSHFLGVANGLLTIDHLPDLIIVIEFLCSEVDENQRFLEPLQQILQYCMQPPLIQKKSDIMSMDCSVSEYIIGLVNCLALVQITSIQLLIIEIIMSIITNKAERSGPDLKGQDYIDSVVTNKMFPTKVCEVLQIIPTNVLSSFLELIMVFLYNSKGIALDLLHCDITNTLLEYLPVVNRVMTADELLIHEYTECILWKLFSCPVPANGFDSSIHAQNIKKLVTWLRQEITTGLNGASFRNDCVSILAELVRLFPNSPFDASAIFYTVFDIIVATRKPPQNGWLTKTIVLHPNAIDLKFFEVLLLLVVTCSKYSALVTLGKSINVLKYFTCYINIGDPDPNQFINPQNAPVKYIKFLCCLLRSMPVLAKTYPEQIIGEKVIQKITNVINYCYNDPSQQKMFVLAAQALTSICSYNECLNNIAECTNELVQLIDIVQKLSEQHHLSTAHQQFISYVLQSISYILKSEKAKEAVSCIMETSVKISLSLIATIPTIETRPGLHTPTFVSLQLADFLWSWVAYSAEFVNTFVTKGGIYKILDHLDKPQPYSVRFLYLGILVDLAEYPISVNQLATWRSYKEPHSVLHLLCTIWRETEALRGVLRKPDGRISDPECPLETEYQLTNESHFQRNYCIPMLEMLINVRPKIYAITVLLLNRHRDVVSLLEETYQIDIHEVPDEDKVTLKLIEYYECLKEGEIWNNISSVSRPQTSIEIAMLEILKLKSLDWSNLVFQEQTAILRNTHVKESEEEKKTYYNINLSKLNAAVTALDEIERVEKVRDKLFRRKTADGFFKLALNQLKSYVGDETFHALYPFELNVTTTKVSRKLRVQQKNY